MFIFFNLAGRFFFGKLKFLKYLIISLCFVLFVSLSQACSCNKIGDPPINNDAQKPSVTLSLDVPTNSIPSFVNSADGFITPMAKLPLKINRATFSKTKVASAKKPCESSIKLSVSNLIAKTTPGTNKAGEVSCSYVDNNTIELTIIPPDIQTTGNDLGVRPPQVSPSVAISTDDALQLTVEIEANNDYVEGLTTNVRFTKNLKLKAKAVSSYSTDISQLAFGYRDYGFLFDRDVVVIDAKSPSTFFTVNVSARYVGTYENSWVGIKSPWNIGYYIFERSRNNNTSHGFFHMHRLSFDRFITQLDFKSGTGNITALSWSTTRDQGGRVTGALRAGERRGIYINHNAPFFIGGNGNFIGFHSGYNHQLSASGGYSPKIPIIKTLAPIAMIDTVPDLAANSDAGHDIFQVVPRTSVFLKVGRNTAPHIQQLNYVNDATAISFRDVPLTGDTPSTDAFQKGNKVLRIADGNIYFYALGGSAPFVGTVTLNPNGSTIDGVEIKTIDNPLGTVDLDLPYVVYNDDNDVLILYASDAGSDESTPTKIFIGRFDNATDSTPTWTRYF